MGARRALRPEPAHASLRGALMIRSCQFVLVYPLATKRGRALD